MAMLAARESNTSDRADVDLHAGDSPVVERRPGADEIRLVGDDARVMEIVLARSQFEAGVTDRDGWLLWLSPRARQRLDLPPGDIPPRNLFELAGESAEVMRSLADEVADRPGAAASATVRRAGGGEGAYFSLQVENWLDSDEIGGLLWWRRPAPSPQPESSRGGQDATERLELLERLLDRLAREIAWAGYGAGPGARSAAELPGVASLNEREREVLDLLSSGLRVSSIAQRLYVSPSTVRNNLSAIYRKLGVRGQSELLELLVSPDRA